MEESRITESIISKAIDFFYLRRFNDGLQILDHPLKSPNNEMEMWKLIIKAEEGVEDVLESAQNLLKTAKDSSDNILEVGASCAQAICHLKNRKFEESLKLTNEADRILSKVNSKGSFEIESLKILTLIIFGSSYLGIADFIKSSEYFEIIYDSSFMKDYLWHRIRAGYTILFALREEEDQSKLLRIAEEVVTLATELEMGDQIRIHYRNLVRMQILAGQYDKARTTYKQMFSSYKRFSTTPKFIENLTLDLDRTVEILNRARRSFTKQPIVIDLPDDTYLFVGDIHGDLEALVRTLSIWENKYNHIIFIGDIVDYGNQQLECLTLITKLMLEFPERVHVLRGNHETKLISSFYGFAVETQVRHKKEIYDIALKMFKEMPIAAVIDNRIFCIHGGVGGYENGEIVQLPEIRNLEKSDTLEGAMYQLLWNDPSEDFDDSSKYFDRGFRGKRTRRYGKRAVEEFCRKSNIETIIRAHSRYDEGYTRLFEGRLWSLFSSKYWDPKIPPKVLGWKENKFRIYDLWKDTDIREKYVNKLFDEIKK